jgi:hypothetical protein
MSKERPVRSLRLQGRPAASGDRGGLAVLRPAGSRARAMRGFPLSYRAWSVPWGMLLCLRHGRVRRHGARAGPRPHRRGQREWVNTLKRRRRTPGHKAAGSDPQQLASAGGALPAANWYFHPYADPGYLSRARRAVQARLCQRSHPRWQACPSASSVDRWEHRNGHTACVRPRGADLPDRHATLPSAPRPGHAPKSQSGGSRARREHLLVTVCNPTPVPADLP